MSRERIETLAFRFLLAVVWIVIHSFMGVAQTPGHGSTSGLFTAGVILEAAKGTSNEDLSPGGFVRIGISRGRVDVRNTLDVEHDKKTFERTGLTVRNRVLAGVLVGKHVRPFFAFEVILQKNPDYQKTGMAPGGGIGFPVEGRDGTKAEPYVYGFGPDSTGNKTKKFGGGVNVEKSRIFVGIEVAKLTFNQPFANPTLHGLTAVDFKFRIGFNFLTWHSNGR